MSETYASMDTGISTPDTGTLTILQHEQKYFIF